jgi:hypothetical protein
MIPLYMLAAFNIRHLLGGKLARGYWFALPRPRANAVVSSWQRDIAF